MGIQKPKNSKWTDEQWEAVTHQGEDILVAAAAGSGKTAVLVERIIRKITDVENPVDVDRLLVATFTKAAASEMRERIREALEKEVYKHPDSEHIRRQLLLLNRANIMTLHSFCKNVIKSHFHLLDIDPGFRVANETEVSLIRQDVLEQVMEEHYGNEKTKEDFWRLVDWFGGERSDEAVFRLTLELYSAAQSHPNPEQWLKKMAGMFEGSGEHELWFNSLVQDVQLELGGIRDLLNRSLRIAESPSGPSPYVMNLREEIDNVSSLVDISEHSWVGLHEKFQAPLFGRLKPCKKDLFDPVLIEGAKGYRDAAKKSLEKLKKELFHRSQEQYLKELEWLAPILNTLVNLIMDFSKQYQMAKLEKNILDFNDLEHFCLRVLSIKNAADGSLEASPAAKDYQNQFAEILLDEYQDTNRVQEVIVQLISNCIRGNRFTVGDVKQSIYRFRLAEPGLFLNKYLRFQKEGGGAGRRIDLACNFRSRREVVNATNSIFKQIMNEAVGEIQYNEDAELVYGATYYDSIETSSNCNVEVLLLDRDRFSEIDEEGQQVTDGFDQETELCEISPTELDDQEPARLEAKVIAKQIKSLLGLDGGQPFQVYDKKLNSQRSATYRDVVILLRSTQNWSPVMLEEFKLQEIPAYADLNTGYFNATEIEVMLSLLKIIDNPFQDIALAAVLRSPIVNLNANDLAEIRVARKKGRFFKALEAYLEQHDSGEGPQSEGELIYEHSADTSLKNRLDIFLTKLDSWRDDARQGSLADLIWKIYRETGYFDFVGGLQGGSQRQANLRALYDRARQYEATSFRGLFRFLRFIERMKENGSDLGTARALGEQENVVRIMSIHKSKGLEFPIVFAAGMAKQFNKQDLKGNFLIHKELGFGPKVVDTNVRVSYPSLPAIAIKRRMEMEMLAEEMRVLYVALTRAREKLFIVGALRNLDRQIASWGKHLEHDNMMLPDYDLSKANCFMDWIGPSLIRHPDAVILRERLGIEETLVSHLIKDNAAWSIHIVDPSKKEYFSEKIQTIQEIDPGREQQVDALLNRLPVVIQNESWSTEIERRLMWTYPQLEATRISTKMSVTEIKRLGEASQIALSTSSGNEYVNSTLHDKANSHDLTAFRRPRFLGDTKLTAAERGTVYHTVMQHLPVNGEGKTIGYTEIEATVAKLVYKRMLTTQQAEVVDPNVIAAFFREDIGKRITQSKHLNREVPFTFGLTAGDIYPDVSSATSNEVILVQGVIDCLFEDEHGLVILDYKTDSTKDKTEEDLEGKYRLQLKLYERAITTIWNKPVVEKYLYFFDGSKLIRVS